jgi:hypothetical protein
MDSFKKREADFETRVALDEELRFKARARRNKLLGLWAAGEMGLDDEAAHAYATKLVENNVGSDDDAALAKSLSQSFASAQKDVSEHRIQRTIEEMAERARTEIAEGR